MVTIFIKKTLWIIQIREVSHNACRRKIHRCNLACFPEKATLEGKNKYLGFWLFLGGETVLFASLFATYLALKDKVPDDNMALAKDLFELPLTFIATMLLLTSSLTSVYAMYHMKNRDFKKCSLGC